MHPARLDDAQLLKQCTLTRGRASGPGGQHRNKVSTSVLLQHTPTKIEASAGERRLARENQRAALRRLRMKLAVHYRTGVKKPRGFEEIASELWKSRRTNGTIQCNVRHRDYPSMLAEALDVLSDSRWDVHKAGIRLGVTSTQLLKLIKKYPPAMEYLNQHRIKRGKHPLK